MNERIKQLASHCGFNTDAMYAGGFPNDHTIALEDFAKLVITDCIDLISPYLVRMENYDSGHPIRDIQKHFGIE